MGTLPYVELSLGNRPRAVEHPRKGCDFARPTLTQPKVKGDFPSRGSSISVILY
jgi:hypothetical protein